MNLGWDVFPRTLGLSLGAGRGKADIHRCSSALLWGREERPGGLAPQEPPALDAAESDRVLLPWQLGPAADLTYDDYLLANKIIVLIKRLFTPSSPTALAHSPSPASGKERPPPPSCSWPVGCLLCRSAVD